MSGVLTFLFTDVEGSTRRWEADADAMRTSMRAHDDVVRRAVSNNAGTVFKHTGDGVCAVFDSPRSAVDAAIAAQRSLELPVRMGISTGEAEHRDDDYFGPVLNRAARVMGAGHGGQILLDGATAGLVGGVDLKALGHRRLRDITTPVELFQVRSAGLIDDFPPLRTLDARPGNLRRPPSSFIGRTSELADLDVLLREHRLVTLTGVGGVGKTRLALELAARIAEAFPDGVWLVELAHVADPQAVPDAVAAVLGIIQQPGLSVVESVAAALDGRSRLLVIDNCEHLLDAAADLIELILTYSHTVRVLATSREGLRVAGEQLWPVPPLDVPDSSVRLFTERAAAVAPAVAIDDEVVIDICRRLDGIPLAIELAASRVQSMSVVELRDRLVDRFQLLVGSRRGVERHQTLRHAIAWSYELLSDPERRLLQHCSVFAGGFDLGAANDVAGSHGEYATFEVLDSLVRKSLVVAHRRGRSSRYSMLETIRQFAEERLVEAGLAEQARAAHARYFAGLEPNLLTTWNGPLQRDAYSWLDTELANLRVAFRWAASTSDIDVAAPIAVCAGFLGGWFELHEPSTWAEELLEPARRLRHRRLRQLCVVASECYRTGRVDDAVRYADAAIGPYDNADFDRMPLDIEPTALGGTYVTIGAVQKWVDLCRKTFERERGINAFNRGALVLALVTAGAMDEAHAACPGLLLSAETTDNPGAKAFAFLAYGHAWRDEQPRDAYDVLHRGLVIARESGNRMAESYLAVNISSFPSVHGSLVDTLDLLALALGNFHDSGSYSHMVAPLGVLSWNLERLGRLEEATTIAGFAATEFALTAFPGLAGAIERLRESMGDEAYTTVSSQGARMTNAEVAKYALQQIDLVRAELDASSPRQQLG